ncbi:hypothetical protein J32TS2_37110 [Shouchella clausii]|uniref:hypothetical protein n=1 Tax=Shouchella TaxID=2893057 RepID=UPI000557DE3B|nr:MULTISPECIES: hypothetical protein [Shouchella]KKI85951.1 hypothetical protein WZ76_12750 [Shouchella clausii]MBU3266139.1 hypothetical protein [Shouchella clausii]MBU3509055.1 hypothetical protein [Shouchella clausii]MBU3533207.1 hypothetical protein [Shouchella clausii]MDP0464164.1 hypothetical protein [Shouchella rhizosphaerae]
MNVKPYATTGSEHYRELNFKQADGHMKKKSKKFWRSYLIFMLCFAVIFFFPDDIRFIFVVAFPILFWGMYGFLNNRTT